eukprot:4661744-Alexandrium_andersonii.AAC.1
MPSYLGKVEDLASILQPFIETKLEFLDYHEKLDAPLDKDRIVAAAPLWTAVLKLHFSLVFTQRQVMDAVRLAFVNAGAPHAQLKDKAIQDGWVNRMSQRFRAMARA